MNPEEARAAIWMLLILCSLEAGAMVILALYVEACRRVNRELEHLFRSRRTVLAAEKMCPPGNEPLA